jgi:hypothetical protein
MADQAPTAVVQIGAEERALLTGDLSKLDADQRSKLYYAVCESLGLNPLTRPFEYLTLNGRLVLYAKKDATDQLRAIHGISITCSKPELIGDVLYVTAHATAMNGRTDEDMGAVSAGNLRGDHLANATMKAITKAKRRVTLSICGLGMLDESEVDTIPTARPTPVVVQEERPKQIPAKSGNGHSADDAPAPDAWRKRLEARALALLESTGQVVEIPVTLTRADCTKIAAEIDRLQAEDAAFAADPQESAVV